MRSVQKDAGGFTLSFSRLGSKFAQQFRTHWSSRTTRLSRRPNDDVSLDEWRGFDLKTSLDTELSRLVDEAANISGSGRWAAVNKRIEYLTANPGVDNDWWVQLFGSLCFQVFSEYLSLKRAHEEKRAEASLLAWRARNLLELSVWCLYCSKSRENARRFYEDAGRDVLGLFSAFTKWGTATAQDPDWLDLFTGAKQKLSQRAASDGIGSLDGAYSKSARRLESLVLATISVLAIECCLSSLIQPPCRFWQPPMK